MHRLAWILLLVSACTADTGDEGFSIIHNLAPGANCALTPGGAFLSRGTIDVKSPNPYLLTPEFTSRITAGEGSEAQRTIALRGARIEVTNATSPDQTIANNKFTSLFAASLSPLGMTTASLDVLTPEIIAQLGVTPTKRVQVVAKVTPFGALGGSGDEIDGVPFEYPITVCDGCVVNNLGACPLPFATVIPVDMANPCNKYQDGVINCCMGPNGPVCPPTLAVQQFAIQLSKTGANAAAANVTSAPAGISCGTTCSANFPMGSMVTLNVAGTATYTWSQAGCAANSPCTVTMDAAKVITLTAP